MAATPSQTAASSGVVTPPIPWGLRRWAPHLLLAVVGAVLLPAYRHGVGLDGLSYLSIAEHYAAGRLDAAVNAYWSPLLSWLVAPLVALGVEPLLAGTVVGLAVAVGAVEALRRLVDALGVRPAAADVAALVAVPFALAAAFFGVFADLLLAALLVAYTAEVLSDDLDRGPDRGPEPPTPPGRARGWWAGAFAALAYLAKLYAVPVVLAHLALVLAWRARPGVSAAARRGALTAGVRVVAVLGATVLAWSAVLSLDAGRPLVSTSAGYNVQLVAPGSEGNPIRYGGLLEPPHPDAVSVWEDPSTMAVEAGSWTASERAAAQRLVGNLTRNLGRTVDGVLGWGGVLLVLAAAVGTVLGLAPSRGGAHVSRPPRGAAVAGVVAAIAVYLGGYQLLWVEDRYLWPVVLWAVALAGVALDRLPTTPTGRRALAALGGALVIAVLGANLDELRLKWRSGAELARTAARLEAADVVGNRVADANNWQRSAILCFHLDCTYLGQPEDPDAPDAELVAADVDTYLVWGEPSPAPPSLSPVPVPEAVDDLRVYAVPTAAPAPHGG